MTNQWIFSFNGLDMTHSDREYFVFSNTGSVLSKVSHYQYTAELKLDALNQLCNTGIKILRVNIVWF